MKNFIKKQVTLVLITFALVGIVLVSSSYALFQKTFVDTKTQSISLGDLSIVFSNGTIVDGQYQELSDSNAITLNNLMPKTDAEAIEDNTNVYNFVIHNGGTLAYSYTIKLQDDEDQTNTLSHNYIRYKINDENPWLLGNATNDIIYEYVINPGESHTFTLKVWLAEAEKYQVPDSALGASAYLRINIEGEAANIRAPKGWKYAEEGTLLYGIKQNEPTVHADGATGMTVPGQAIATTDEGLREAKDDYGTSYYYRGAVEDNYVVFANKCWRIVRITGDGSIKLVLHNNDAATCDINGDYTKNFAKYDGANFKSAFNNSGRTVSEVGFMHGDANATNYLDALANTTDSLILTRLKAWYDLSGTFTNNEKDMLADVIWCGDKSLYSGFGYGTNPTVFSASDRLNNYNISLVCPSIEENIKLSKYTASSSTDGGYGNGALNGYKIGLLTADEAAFAGAYRWTDNSNYYLYNSTSNYVMSPYRFSDKDAYIWSVSGTGALEGAYANYERQLRPAIALKSDVRYTVDTSQNADAPGTATNPFVIVEN